LVSLFAISLYITIRFDKKYALLALLALFHDLLIVFGIFSWLGIILSVEVNSLFAVSLLTIAGYSVNDTVVIFDRIRENLKSNKEGYNETVQLSVNESFRRTTFTSITTLIPLLSIILFGSYSLFWFSLALSLGIIVEVIQVFCWLHLYCLKIEFKLLIYEIELLFDNFIFFSFNRPFY
jgi:preprotein translocase subunit SecF